MRWINVNGVLPFLIFLLFLSTLCTDFFLFRKERTIFLKSQYFTILLQESKFYSIYYEIINEGGNILKKSFYHYVLTFRGGEWSDEKVRFAESMFLDHGFPKNSYDFEELSNYIEFQSDEYLTIGAFDVLWDLYETKFSS